MDAATQSPPAAYLPGDLVVEILLRLPAKSLCRLKCVSRSWQTLFSDPAHRHRFARTLSGFFFRRPDTSRPPPWGFTGLSSASPPLDDPSLSFLPPSYGKIEPLDSCNGLLLLRCSPPASGGTTEAESPPPPSFYIVCNPATGEWVSLPQPSVEPGLDDTPRACSAALGFDPAVSPHFHVFQLVEDNYRGYYYAIDAVEIYSSETGAWALHENKWGPRGWPSFAGHTAYFNGFQHFTTSDNVIALVDAKGQSWRTITVPFDHSLGNGFVGHSQGHLLYMDEETDENTLEVYVLEDHSSEEWTFKHRVSKVTLLTPQKFAWELDDSVAALHTRCDRIFFYDRQLKRLMYYDMNQGRVDVICTLEVADETKPLLPYVPLYSRTFNHQMFSASQS